MHFMLTCSHIPQHQHPTNAIPRRAPAMYIYNPKDSLYYIVPSFSRVYYRINYRNNRSEINPFPLMLQIVMGDASRRAPWGPNEVRDTIVWTNRTWNRADADPQRNGDWSYLKAASSADIGRMKELEMKVKFPSCLQVQMGGSNPGPVTSSPNFRDHVAYLGGDLRCPDTHPYHIPEVDLEIRYQLDKIRKQLGADVVNDTANWILSNGDTTGVSAHADFLAGWPEDLMSEMIDHCHFGRDFGGGQCPISKYMNKSRREMETKVVSFTNPVPNGVVSPVQTLPSMNDPCCIGC
jgi:Domain of unknown function (DUF1996)